ncbi:hypothetical protein GE107_25575 [Cohnella sp. CFH 77786]|nr:hypothetical protein [Cohnella sp. CFH 77786]MBW5449401.1 hypothetical protein [Cohnella sp. CFH 77786]
MRQLLMTVMLIAVVVSLYASTVQGDDGMKAHIRDSGVRMADGISRISP